ncbi:MAG: hypothetical protein IJ679_11150 [Lachnospiraceae bacterium]|nr:hypothetical protein [Lachnospiraceae bacterium]
MYDEAMRLLKQVPDYYEDFMISMRSDLKRNPGLVQPVIDFLTEDREHTTSDILGFCWQMERNVPVERMSA